MWSSVDTHTCKNIAVNYTNPNPNHIKLHREIHVTYMYIDLIDQYV